MFCFLQSVYALKLVLRGWLLGGVVGGAALGATVLEHFIDE
jgi:hypothetical protein